MDRRRRWIDELAAHRASGEAERRDRERTLDLLAAPGDPFDRARFDPGHVTSSAYVLSPAGDALLMVLHGKLGRWLQPGGHVEADDPDGRAAARREVLEETGLSALHPVGPGCLDVDVHEIPGSPERPRHEHFDVRYLFRAGSTRLRSGSDALDAAWIPLSRLAGLDPDPAMRRVFAKLVGRGGD